MAWTATISTRWRLFSAWQKDALAVKRFIENARANAQEPYLGDDEMPYDWDIE